MMKPLSGARPLLGVIGGMGTQATACFYDKLHKLQNVTKEQDYLDVLLYSKPSVPDRTAFIVGQSDENPLDSLINAAGVLESAGVSCIAIPCITSHYFYEKLAVAVDTPILNLLDETAAFVAERNVRRICLLATDGTVRGRVFDSAFERRGIDVLFPSSDVQSDLMGLIYDIKTGASTTSVALDAIVEHALESGAQAVVLGCTELCVVAGGSPKVVNTLDVLALAALRQACGSD